MDIYAGGVPASQSVREWIAEGDTRRAAELGIVAAAIHAACWLCENAIKRGVLTVSDALGDRGIVHELAHAAALDPSRDVQFLITLNERIVAVEAALMELRT